MKAIIVIFVVFWLQFIVVAVGAYTLSESLLFYGGAFYGILLLHWGRYMYIYIACYFLH